MQWQDNWTTSAFSVTQSVPSIGLCYVLVLLPMLTRAQSFACKRAVKGCFFPKNISLFWQVGLGSWDESKGGLPPKLWRKYVVAQAPICKNKKIEVNETCQTSCKFATISTMDFIKGCTYHKKWSETHHKQSSFLKPNKLQSTMELEGCLWC